MLQTLSVPELCGVLRVSVFVCECGFGRIREWLIGCTEVSCEKEGREPAPKHGAGPRMAAESTQTKEGQDSCNYIDGAVFDDGHHGLARRQGRNQFFE